MASCGVTGFNTSDGGDALSIVSGLVSCLPVNSGAGGKAGAVGFSGTCREGSSGTSFARASDGCSAVLRSLVGLVAVGFFLPAILLKPEASLSLRLDVVAIGGLGRIGSVFELVQFCLSASDKTGVLAGFLGAKTLNKGHFSAASCADVLATLVMTDSSG